MNISDLYYTNYREFVTVNGIETIKKVVDLRPTDLPIVLAAAVILFFLRQTLITTLFKRLGIGFHFKGTELKRFEEHLWFAVYYTIQTSIGYYLLRDAIWMNDMQHLLKGFPHWEDDSLWIRSYYLIQFGFYVQALYGLLFVDERMKDFSELVLHHCFTLILITTSLVSRFHRIGSYILLLHDVVDVILYNGKVVHYMKWETLANLFFAVFILFGLGYLRLVCFPKLIVYLWCSEYGLLLPAFHYSFIFDPSAHPLFEITSYGLCVGQFCVSSKLLYAFCSIILVLLHSYWFVLALRVAYATIVTGKIVDIREEASTECETITHLKLE